MALQGERSLILLQKNLVITIPKAWSDFWDLKKGEKVQILYNGILIIVPPKYPQKGKLKKSFIRGFV